MGFNAHIGVRSRPTRNKVFTPTPGLRRIGQIILPAQVKACITDIDRRATFKSTIRAESVHRFRLSVGKTPELGKSNLSEVVFA